MERFFPMRLGEPPTSYSDLHKKYGLAEKTIQTAIFDAFKRGLVTLQPASLPPPYDEVQALEDALCRRFPSLRQAIVVRPLNKNVGSDELHLALGHALAQRIHSSLMFGPNATIGVGTGRAVHYTIERLARLPAVRAQGASIISLTGSFFMLTEGSRELSTGFDQMVDADTNATLLIRYFVTSTHVHPISLPIAVPDDARSDLLRPTPLFDVTYNSQTPSHAIVGLGMFRADNGLVQHVKRGSSRTSAVFSPIWEPLRNLISHVDRVTSLLPSYCPVGDLCSRLFYIPPKNPNGVSREVSYYLDMIQEGVAYINSRLITATKDQLKKIPHLILIAGSSSKADGIDYILRHENLDISVLCTDLDTAQFILSNRSQADG